MTHEYGAKTKPAMMQLILEKVGRSAAKPLAPKPTQVATSFCARYLIIGWQLMVRNSVEVNVRKGLMALWGGWIWTTCVFWSLSLFLSHARCRRRVKEPASHFAALCGCMGKKLPLQGWMDPGILCQKSSYLVCVNIFLWGWCSYISTLRYGCFVIPVPWITEFLWARSK